MTFIRKHKFIIVFITIFIIILLFVGILFSQILSEDENDKYGNRIDGIENVKITDSRVDNIKGKILNEESINKITFRLDGKLIKFFIEVKKDNYEFNIDNVINIIIGNFEESEKKYYDFEIFVTCEEKQKLYPIIAYKHRNNQMFTITKKEGSNDEE